MLLRTAGCVVAIPHNCSRCGKDFLRFDNERICTTCRKPPCDPRNPPTRELSPRQKHIVALVRKGMRNKTIAHELHLSEGTIKTYMNHIFNKLRVSNRTELAMWAVSQDTENKAA